MPTIDKIAGELNRRSADTPFGRLQVLRKNLKAMSRSAGKLPFRAVAPERNWTHHLGGYDELQFNIGEESPITESDGDLRYGIAFSYKTNQSLHDINILKPKIALLNDYIRQNREDFADLWMWFYFKDMRSRIYRPEEISEEQMKPGTFFFIGLATKSAKPDYDNMVCIFNRLLPVYLYVEGGHKQISAPSRPAISFTPGFLRGMTETISQMSATYRPVVFRHKLIQEKLYALLVEEYGFDYVGVEQPTGNGGLIDMLVQTPQRRVLFEIKTASSARGCIREALGQIMDYALWPGSLSPDEIVIVGEPPATETEISYMQILAKSLQISLSYKSIYLNYR